MPRIDVPFIVEKQHITQPTREQLVAGGQNYFYATFKTCDTWEEIPNAKAVFVRDDVSKLMPLSMGDNDCLECEIPWEVMADKGSFQVGIFGGNRLLTNYAYVIVKEGCVVDGESPKPPTPDWFAVVSEYLEQGGTGNINSKAVSEDSAAFGKDNVAGSLGYYIKSIDPFRRKIYLSTTQIVPTFSEDDNTDVTFPTPAYDVGNYISIINGSHYAMTASIVDIENNVITYTGDLGFVDFGMLENPDPDEYTVVVPKQADVGVVEVGKFAFAVGKNNFAYGNYAYAEGKDNIAGNHAHAEGRENTATVYGHAEGYQNRAYGHHSHAEGRGNVTEGENSHVEGFSNKTIGENTHAEGQGNIINGQAGHGEGNGNTVGGMYSHAEGSNNEVTSLTGHAEGYVNKVYGKYGHAEGYYNTIEEGAAHSHVECHDNVVSGSSSHAEGQSNVVTGNITHVEGFKNRACGDYQHVQGIMCSDDPNMAHIVGGGNPTTGERKNIHMLDWHGNAWFTGEVEAKAIILSSSTAGSTKRFRITVDDSGTIKATEI